MSCITNAEYHAINDVLREYGFLVTPGGRGEYPIGNLMVHSRMDYNENTCRDSLYLECKATSSFSDYPVVLGEYTIEIPYMSERGLKSYIKKSVDKYILKLDKFLIFLSDRQCGRK